MPDHPVRIALARLVEIEERDGPDRPYRVGPTDPPRDRGPIMTAAEGAGHPEQAEIERPPRDLPDRDDYAVIRSVGAVLHWQGRWWGWDGHEWMAAKRPRGLIDSRTFHEACAERRRMEIERDRALARVASLEGENTWLRAEVLAECKAEVTRLRARTHEIQAQEMAKRAALDSEVAQWQAKWEYAKQWTEREGLRAEWAAGKFAESPFWGMTSYAGRAALLRLVTERDEFRAEQAALRARVASLEEENARLRAEPAPVPERRDGGVDE